MAEARRVWGRWRRAVVVALVVAVAALAAPPVGVPNVSRIVVDTFERGELKGWIERQYNGRTIYRVVSEGQNKFVMAHSRASASALGKLVRFDPVRLSHLEWRWKIEDIIDDGRQSKIEVNDHAAGVCVIFAKGLFPWQMHVINYVWANTLEKGAMTRHPSEENVRIVAVESGRTLVRRWIRERRNLAEDYRKLFGDEPPQVVAIAIMTDTDHTGTQATAYYDDIIVRR